MGVLSRLPHARRTPPLWYGLGHLAGAEWAATNRVNVITNNTWDASKPLFERYREVWQRKHGGDRKSTRLNSSHSQISYAVFCLKQKKYSARAYSYTQTR